MDELRHIVKAPSIVLWIVSQGLPLYLELVSGTKPALLVALLGEGFTHTGRKARHDRRAVCCRDAHDSIMKEGASEAKVDGSRSLSPSLPSSASLSHDST